MDQVLFQKSEPDQEVDANAYLSYDDDCHYASTEPKPNVKRDSLHIELVILESEYELICFIQRSKVGSEEQDGA